MSEQRIYNEKVDISGKSVESFYDSRAQNIDKMNNPYSAVLLSDHAPELIDMQIKIEKEYISSRLKIDNSSKVLDIGCGIGRWAEEIIPACASYYGLDFSKKMIEIARKRTEALKSDNFKFEKLSFQELMACSADKVHGIYNRIIISNVLMYICDDDVSMCLKSLLGFLDKSCIIYIWEPCGVGQRLTLKDFPSETLKTDYNVIYRTKDEYDNIFASLLDNGFSVSFNEYYSKLGGMVTYSDTDKIYYILER